MTVSLALAPMKKELSRKIPEIKPQRVIRDLFHLFRVQILTAVFGFQVVESSFDMDVTNGDFLEIVGLAVKSQSAQKLGRSSSSTVNKNCVP